MLAIMLSSFVLRLVKSSRSTYDTSKKKRGKQRARRSASASATVCGRNHRVRARCRGSSSRQVRLRNPSGRAPRALQKCILVLAKAGSGPLQKHTCKESEPSCVICCCRLSCGAMSLSRTAICLGCEHTRPRYPRRKLLLRSCRVLCRHLQSLIVDSRDGGGSSGGWRKQQKEEETRRKNNAQLQENRTPSRALPQTGTATGCFDGAIASTRAWTYVMKPGRLFGPSPRSSPKA